LADQSITTTITTYMNIQSQPIYISPTMYYNISEYKRNVYLQSNINVYANPNQLVLYAGSNSVAFRFSNTKSGIYYIFFSKTGDGNYYCNLPPLTLTVLRNYLEPLVLVEKVLYVPVAPSSTIYNIPINLPYELYPML